MLYKTRKSVAQALAQASARTAWLHTHLFRLSLFLETPLSTRPAFLLPGEARLRLTEVIAAAKNSGASGGGGSGGGGGGSGGSSSSVTGSCSDVAHCRLSVNDYIMCRRAVTFS